MSTVGGLRYNVAIMGMPFHEVTLLRSLFRIIDGRTAQHWDIDPARPAQVVIGDAASPQLRALPAPPVGPLVIALQRASARATAASALSLTRPLRVQTLLDTLTVAGECLASRSYGTVRVDPDSVVLSEAQAAQDALAGPFLGVLRSLARRRDDDSYRITGDGPAVIVWPRAARYWSELDLVALARALRTVGEVRAHSFAAEIPHYRERGSLRPLRDLLWLTGLYAPAGQRQLVPREGFRYRLTGWSELMGVPNARAFVAIGAHLNAASLTFAELRSRSGMRDVELAALLSACDMCGCLVSTPAAVSVAPAPVAPATRDAPVLGLLRRIRDRLRKG